MLQSGIQPRPSLDRLPVYVPGRSVASVLAQYGIASAIKLASNENPLGPGKQARRALAQAALGAAIYPDGLASELAQALAALWDWPEEGFAIGNGSDEIFVLLAQSYLCPGRCALVSEHTFSEYGFSSQLAGADIVTVPMPSFRYDLDAFVERAAGTSVAFICNPNNPTGTHHGHDALRRFLSRMPSETLVVLDEAYAEYVRDEPVRTRELLQEFPNLAVTRTFSKIHGLAAARVGYLVARPDIVSSLRRGKTPFNVNGPGQAAARAALADRVHAERSFRMNAQGMRQIERGLQARGFSFLPSQANFLFIEIRRDERTFCEEMMRRGVIVRGTRSFGYPGAIRVTIGTRSQNDAFLRVFDEACSAVPEARLDDTVRFPASAA